MTELPVVVFKLEPGDQLYVVPPEAVNVTEDPEQIVELAGEIFIVGPGLILTVATAVFEQPLDIPVTM